MNKAKIETMTAEEAKERGYATFTNSTINPHTVIDLSDVKEGAHTISVKLQNGDSVTMCMIAFFQADGGQSGTIDFKYHNEEKETRVIAFKDGKDEEIKGPLYTLDYK